MKILYLDCSMGAAGDMLAAALLELQPDPAAALDELNALGIPGVEFVREPAARCGIAATHLSVRVDGQEEVCDPDRRHEGGGRRHYDHHDQGRDPDCAGVLPAGQRINGSHVHRSLADIAGLIGRLHLPDRVANNARAVYARIAAAEGRAHGCEVNLVHFHEVGALDAVADIVACCHLMERLAPERVVASPVHVGSGSVKCAHGVMPVPAPATAFLLEGVPAYSDGAIVGELCTPTGAALLRHFVSEFGPMPLMRVAAMGHGAGRKEFPRANVLRTMLGESGLAPAGTRDDVFELACNIDDMDGEALAFAADAIRAAGALDVTLVPAIMKKGRPGTILLALCPPDGHDAVVTAILRHTSTLGVRETLLRRTLLGRTEATVGTPLGELRLKTATGFGIERAKFEYDDLASAASARGLSLDEARRLSGR